MKRILLPIIAALTAALVLSCGSGKDQALSYFQELASLYDQGDISAYSNKKTEFGDFLRGLDAEGDAALYEAFCTFRDGWSGKGRFNDYLYKMLWYETNTAETVALLVTHLYAAAEPQAHLRGDAEKEHPAAEDLRTIRGLQNSSLPSGSGYWEIIDPWKKQLEAQEQKFEAKRLITREGIGPVLIGASISALPAAEEGLYDYIVKQVETFEDAGDSWEETVYNAFYLGQVAFVIYPEYENEDAVRTILVKSFDFHTESGVTPASWPKDIFRAGGIGFYICDGYNRPYFGATCDGLIIMGLGLSYNGERRVERHEGEVALWLDEDSFSSSLTTLSIWVPAKGQMEDIWNTINDWD